MIDDYYDKAEVQSTNKAGTPGTLKELKKEVFKGRLVGVRYYKHKVTGEKRKTLEIEPIE